MTRTFSQGSRFCFLTLEGDEVRQKGDFFFYCLDVLVASLPFYFIVRVSAKSLRNVSSLPVIGLQLC